MDVMKLIKRFEERIEKYEEKRKSLEDYSYEHMLLSARIIELRFVLCEICEWVFSETLPEGTVKIINPRKKED